MWTFADAKNEMESAEQAHKDSEQAIRDAAQELAQAERDYEVSLRVKMMQLRADGTPATACERLARGDKDIAHLRYMRTIKEGAFAAAKAANYRHSATRNDVLKLADWSMRHEQAVGAQNDPRLAWSGRQAS